jgi:hypothetical protein
MRKALAIFGAFAGALAVLLVVTPDVMPDLAARERVAQLAPAPAPDLKPVKINPGIIYNKAGQPLAPLAVDAPAGTNYALKFVHAANGKDAMMIYVVGGQAFQIKAPLGTYKVRGASGTTWYGVKHLFGPTTSYFKLRSKASTSAEGDNFAFTRSGNQVHGFRITLIKQSGGNLETNPIKAEEF